ncbi:MAG: flagellar biosynthesis protein FlhA, partial [Deltaproteobacteria bacterium]|nr:flagellar biosynthesis protein FlhA [Deltaproteobacteria bacterium]
MAELGIVIAILVAVVGLITPIPPLLLDFFVTANLLFALLVLILSITIKDVLQLSSFPAILLTNTIFRICLSVAITRSILGDIAGGEVVKMFGLTLLGGNLILGIVVYVLITIIQFFVIAKGGERVAEVSARFSLDSLPGRQMAIDADLRMGIIDPDTARQKRQELQNESRFFGALDGTMKFVKGDAIAGIIIVAVNLIGGILIGLIYHDLDLSSAVRTFATLSLGEGLISQIPSFLNGLAAGFLVTRVEKDSTSVGSLVVRQIFDPVAPKFILGVLSFAIAVTSPLPGILFSVLGIGLIVIALAQSAINSQKFKKELFTFQPKLDDLLTIELNINDDNLM